MFEQNQCSITCDYLYQFPKNRKMSGKTMSEFFKIFHLWFEDNKVVRCKLLSQKHQEVSHSIKMGSSQPW